ncbi:thioredoxin family protein [Bacteroidota bacterium]
MRRILITAGLILFTITSFSQEKVKWYTIEEAQELNKKEPKKFIIDVYTDWCGWCKKMDQTTFGNPAIAGYLNKYYYPVKFNAESKNSIIFAGKEYVNAGGNRQPHNFAVALLQGKMSYPSIAYLNEKLQLLSAVPGYYTPDRIEPILVYFAENIYQTTSWQDFSDKFESKILK